MIRPLFLPRFLVLTLASAVVAIGCRYEPGNTKGPPANPAVTLQLLDYAGIQKLVASHRGKVVVMDAWSTACPPCIKEFPNLVALSTKYGSDKLACISLSFDYDGIGRPEDVRDKVQMFLDAQRATFDNVLSTDESDVLYRKFNLVSIPAVFVYDRDGKLVKRFDNENAATEAEAFTYEQVGAKVAQLLAADERTPQ